MAPYHSSATRATGPLAERLAVAALLIAMSVMGLVHVGAAAEGEGFTGNVLHRLCQSADVKACEDEIDEFVFLFGEAFCVPEAATFQQIVDVVKLYLVNHPERRHLSGWDMIDEAVSQAWPCD